MKSILCYSFRMITVDEALEKILSNIHPLGFEKVSILDALGRVIGEDILAQRNIPPFDNSAMDGYALISADVQKASSNSPVRLEVIADLPAGAISTKKVQKGEAVRIMTGAPVPEGADTVVPVEETKKENGSVLILRAAPTGEKIRRSGEDVRTGDRVISKNDVIRPAEVGMLASVGRSFVYVYQRPLVAILCTGDELVDVDGNLDEVKIISSNSYSLASQVKDCGATPLQLGIAKDRKEEIEEKFRQGIRADVVISSAGVSVGDYDFVKDVMKRLGMEMIFWKVAMRPGAPLAFGTIGGKPMFGLPGNPVSSMISFEQFVRPSLLKMMGHRKLFRPVVDAVLKEDIKKAVGKRYFLRGSVSFEKDQYLVTTTGEQGSGILRSMVKGNGLIVIPEEKEKVRAGEKVKVQLLDRNIY